MFDAIKAMAQGWKTQGKYPGVDPYLAKPYTDAAIWFIEDKAARLKTKMHICDEDENTVPFDFTYDVFSFSLCKAVAYLKNEGEAQQRLITEILRQVIESFGKNRPAVAIGQAIIIEADLRALHQIYRLADGTESIGKFAEMRMQYAALIDVAFATHSLEFMKIMLADSGVSQTKEERMIAITRQISRYVVLRATLHPTAQKESIFSLRVASLLLPLMGTK